MKKNILFAWIGTADLRAVEGAGGLGPIAQAVSNADYDQVVLLSDYARAKAGAYKKWLSDLTDADIQVQHHKLSGPTNFGEIYEAARETVEGYLASEDTILDTTFHLSPGTPAMAAVWIILAKTRFPARLIESSREAGVKVVSLPFDISAEYLPDLLRKSDEELARLSLGLPTDAPEFESIIHRSDVMKRVIAKARRAAPRDIPVLILGDSGTGKELLSRAIWKSSLRKNKPFIAVNCGAIPSSLVDAELFGHEKNAFTGAGQRRIGHVEKADGGTLFLDEIGELPADVQVRLLRVLQEGEVVRVGSTDPVKVNFRLIAATNRDLTTEMSEGRFRSDLFHRIAVAILKVPPIRERPGDLGLLIDNLLDQINEENKGQPGYEHKKLSATARNIMLHHHWPGNVRELHNTLMRAAVWSTGSTIGKQDAQEALLPLPKAGERILGQPLGNGFDIKETLGEVARHYLQRAMSEAADNKTKAAELIGLGSYQTLTDWLDRYGMK